MTEQETNIEKIFEALNKSPLYNLSMCSLENFHTNFLVWLGKTYPQQTLELLANCIENEDIKKWENIEFVTQENLGKDCKFDLCVKDKNSKIRLVLENKIKSYPTEEQLEKYDKELKDKGHDPVKIFLTLLPCDLKDCNSWQQITYSSFKFKDIFSDEFWKNQVENINKDEIEDEIKDEISYNKSLISDYSKLIKNLVSGIEKVENRANDNQKELNSLLYENINSFAEELKNIKFDNAYKKYKTGELTNYIKNHIPNEINVENIKFSTDFSQQNDGVINIEKSYFISPKSPSNKKPKPDFILSIQIQGNEYRRCLVYGTKGQEENRFNFANNKLKGSGIWFSDDDLENYSKKSSYSRFTENEKILYRGYSPDRIFRHFDMAKKELNTYKSIAEQVKSDIKHLNDHQEDIQKAYNDFLNGKSSTSDKT